MSNETFSSVWDAIEDSPAEAESMKLRSMLMMMLERHIKGKGWTQAKAARQLGVTQPRVFNLLNGKIDLFSLDMMVMMAGDAKQISGPINTMKSSKSRPYVMLYARLMLWPTLCNGCARHNMGVVANVAEWRQLEISDRYSLQLLECGEFQFHRSEQACSSPFPVNGGSECLCQAFLKKASKTRLCVCLKRRGADFLPDDMNLWASVVNSDDQLAI